VERLVHRTTSLCRVCKVGVDAEVTADEHGAVWMNKRCSEHGVERVRISTSAEWYERTRAIKPIHAPPPRAKPTERGCPFDCGPCEQHTQRIRMPVVTITSACDLDCPICYVHNKNRDAFHMQRDEFARVLDRLLEANDGDVDLINLTGGEPLLHPDIVGLVAMCRAAGIHRVSVCTNGIRLVKDRALFDALAEQGTRFALSFDTFDPHVDRALQGAKLVDLKLQCLDLLEAHAVNTTLIPVMTRGYNDHEIGRILDVALRLNCVRHVEVHTITYTGQGGVHFDRSGRISTFEVLQRIAETTNGLLGPDDFVPSPSAHPLCYQIAYLLNDASGPISFRRFLDRDTYYEALGDHLYLEPNERLERAMQDALARLWAEDDPESARIVTVLDRLTRELFPVGRAISREESLRIAERSVKAIYVHSHMDEETFDVERAAQCCDSNCYADGKTIPVCNYNVLYREREARFMETPRITEPRGGRVSLPLLVARP
jgi:7,8-dihydro-6-hydroxymethylpterin dimethyltransferase